MKNELKKSITLAWFISFINILCLILIIIGRDLGYNFLLWLSISLLTVNLIVYIVSVQTRLKSINRNLLSIIFQPIFILFFIYYSLYKLGYLN